MDKNYVDVNIDRVEKHENYEPMAHINDIAIVFLVNDVEFTGWLENDSFLKKLRIF